MDSEIIVCNGARHLGIQPTISYESSIFANGEINVLLKDSVRSKDVTILQSFNRTNTHLMELMIMIDAVKRSGAGKVNLILPIFPYSRQDRRHTGGTPISAKVVMDMFKAVNVDRILTIDLHADQVQGFIPNNIQFDHISAAAFMACHLKKELKNIDQYMMVSPDAGSIKRAKRLAGLCGITDLAILNKVRSKANVVDSTQIIGDVDGKNVILIDDMIDTAGTLQVSIQALREANVKSVVAVATHGIFSNPAYERLNGTKLFITDTLKIWETDKNGVESPPNMKIIPVKNFLLDILHRIHHNIQLSTLFTTWNE